MEHHDQGAQCISFIVIGSGIAICSAIFMISLSSPTLLGIEVAFCHFVPGLVMWPCTAGIVVGIGIALIGCLWPFIRKS